MFRHRSYKKELLDEDDIPRDLLYQNLRELEVINKWLGGINISLNGLKRATKNYTGKIVLADIGCGGGDALEQFAKKNKNIDLYGIDLKEDCIAYAQQHCKAYKNIQFIQGDYREVIRELTEVTHVHAALFCHHLSEEEIIELIQFCQQHKKTLITNDLERHPFAYYSIYWLTRIFNGSSLVKNDAPLSVLRGFKKREWRDMLDKAGVDNYHLSWQWAFRHLIIIPT